MAEQPGAKPVIGLTCRWDEAKGWYYLPAEYARAVAAAGAVPVQIPLLPEIAAELASRLDGFVLCGSPSDVDPARYGQQRHPEVTMIHPDRDQTDWNVLGHAFGNRKPVLGICYGMQMLNVYRQGTLVQHIPAGVPAALEHKDEQARHAIGLEPGSGIAQWARVAGDPVVNSTHHQAVEQPGRGLRVAARAPDGVIEAIEGDCPGHFVLGVQWHPERIWETEPLSARLFAELVKAAGEWRAAAGSQSESPRSVTSAGRPLAALSGKDRLDEIQPSQQDRRAKSPAEPL